MSSSLRFGDYLLLGRTHQNVRVDSYMACSCKNNGSDKQLYLLSRLRGSARKALPDLALSFQMAGEYLQELQQVPVAVNNDVGENEGQLFWARPYIVGRTLQQIQKKMAHLRNDFSESIVCYIASELAKTLPDFLPVSEQLPGGGEILLACYAQHTIVGYDGAIINADNGLDFWLAKQPVANVTAAEWRAPYVTPEELNGGAVGAPSAVYTLGSLLYELLTGRRIFGKSSGADLNEKIISGAYQQIGEIRSDIDGSIISFVDSMLSPELEVRPKAQEVLDFFTARIADGREQLLSLLKRDFKEEAESDKKKIAALKKKVSEALTAELAVSKNSLPDEEDIEMSFQENGEEDMGTDHSEEFNATIISPASSVGDYMNGEVDPFGATLPSGESVAQQVQAAVQNQQAGYQQSVGATQVGQPPMGYQVNPYGDNYGMMQQPMYPPAPMGVVPTVVNPAVVESRGFGAGGWFIIVLTLIISIIMVVCSIMYSKGRLPQLERFGLPHIESVEAAAISPSSNVAPVQVQPVQNK